MLGVGRSKPSLGSLGTTWGGGGGGESKPSIGSLGIFWEGPVASLH